MPPTSPGLPPTSSASVRDVTGLLRSLGRADWPSLRAAWWAQRAVLSVRRQLQAGGIERLRVPRAPNVPPSSARGVAAILRRRNERCLVSAAVWQQWHVAQGSRPDLVIGVAAPGEDFHAHAWLDSDPSGGEGFVEISRHPARL